MKHILLLASILCLSFCSGQKTDLIITSDSITYMGKVLEISDTYIRFQHNNGTVQKIEKRNLIYIKTGGQAISLDSNSVKQSFTRTIPEAPKVSRIQKGGAQLETAGVLGLSGLALGILGGGIAAAGFINNNTTLQYVGYTVAGIGVALNIGGFAALIVAGQSFQTHK